MNKIGKIILSAPPKNKLSDLLNDCKPISTGESLPLKSGLKVNMYKTIKDGKASLQQGRFCFVNHANVPVQNLVVMFLSEIYNKKHAQHAINKEHLESAIIVFSVRSLTIDQWLIHQQHYKQNAS